jgi:putative ABC transport system permease protein
MRREGETGALRFYRGFLRLYPSEFRDEYAAELCFAFADLWRGEQSLAGRLRVSLHALAGVLIEAPREHCHMIAQDLRYAVRTMRKDAGMTAAAIAILALGIGAATLVFSLANGLLLRPLPYPEPGRIVSVNEINPAETHENGALNFLNYRDLRARTRTLSDLGLYGGDSGAIRGEGAAERVLGADTTDGFFGTLRMQPLIGRLFTREDMLPSSERVVVIGEDLWSRRYGRDPKILGRRLQIDDAQWAVVGILPSDFRYPGRCEMWRPLRLDPAKELRTDYGLVGIARLAPGVSMGEAKGELQALLDQIHRENPAADNHSTIRIRPMRDFMAGGYRNIVLVLLGGAALLLAIACANVSNLLLVKASGRAAELAVRTALGATRTRLIRQLVSEGALLGAAGGLLGIGLAYLGLPVLLSLIPVDLPAWMHFSVDIRVVAFAIAVSLATTIGFALAPALGWSAVNLADSLRAAGHAGGSGVRQKLMRDGLVVAEVALCVTLLAAAGLMVRSFVAMRYQELGYRPENVLTLGINYPEDRYPRGASVRALLDRIGGEIAAIPGVSSLAFTTGVPLHDGWSRVYTVEGRPQELKDMDVVDHVAVAPGYFHVLGIGMIEGRDFTEADYDSEMPLIVTEAFARKHWPGTSALGKRVRFGPPARNGPWRSIVGVARDERHGSLKGQNRPTVYVPYSVGITADQMVIRTSTDPIALKRAVESRIVSIDPDLVVGHLFTLGQLIDQAAWQDRFLTVLFTVFAALALALAAVGLYGVISYTVARSTREIGIRMALGASAAGVRGMVVRQGMTLAGIGLAIGLAAALALTRLLESQLYRVSPADPAAYGIAIALLLGSAGLAAWLPARRATRIDPAIALRSE